MNGGQLQRGRHKTRPHSRSSPHRHNDPRSLIRPYLSAFLMDYGFHPPPMDPYPEQPVKSVTGFGKPRHAPKLDTSKAAFHFGVNPPYSCYNRLEPQNGTA